MKTLKNILVPTDFSNDSLNSLEYAIHLAEKFSARLTVLHSYHVYPPASDAYLMPNTSSMLYLSELEEIIKINASEKFYAFADKYLEGTKVKYEFVLRQGITKYNTLEVAEEKEIDLIIMSKENPSKTSQLFGTHVTHLMKSAPIPVMVIPDGVVFNGLSRILLCWDKAEIENNRDVLIQLAEGFQSSIEIFNVLKDDEELFEDDMMHGVYMNSLFKSIPHYHLSRLGKDTQAAILEEAVTQNVDLLVLVPRHKDLIERIFAESISKNVVLTATFPLLILPQ